MISPEEEAVLHTMNNEIGYRSARFIYLHLPVKLRQTWQYKYFATSIMRQLAIKKLIYERPCEAVGISKEYRIRLDPSTIK